jgi:hypothetical protein
MQRLPTGSPNFKGARRQHRQSDYDLKKAILEFVDNIITKCKSVNVLFNLTDQEKGHLSKLSISDDYPKGFEHMFKEGTENPFNMTHMRCGQDDDQETSQFGIGLKAGAISTGDRLDVFTKVGGKFYCVEMDFLEMCERVIDSFSPNVREITEEEYNNRHPFQYGSTLIISSINPSIYKHTTAEDLKTYLKKELSYTYNDIIKDTGVVLKVNNEPIYCIPDIYDEPECLPFTRNGCVYKYEEVYYLSYEDKYYIFEPANENVKSKKKLPKGIKKKDCAMNIEVSEKIADIKSTFTFYKTYGINDEMPRGHVHLYRKGRRYGYWKGLGSINNGSKNYNITRIDMDSKEVAKKLGLTYNKTIAENMINLETSVFKEFIQIMTDGFNADTSVTANFKLYNIAKRENIEVVFDKLPTSIKMKEEPSTKTVRASRPAKVEKPVKVPERIIKAETFERTETVKDETAEKVPERIMKAETVKDETFEKAETFERSETAEKVPERIMKAETVKAETAEKVADKLKAETAEKTVKAETVEKVETERPEQTSLSDDQLDILLKKERNILKNHPAIIRAYKEIMNI